ncbi:MAG: ribosome biogenesis factor YjgA [Granulosicoccaceae bacterium]
MVDDNSPKSSEDDDSLALSKSQRKRDAHEVRDLGGELAALGASERARVPIPEDILREIDKLNACKANGARKRQLGFLAKQLRRHDVQPMLDALEAIRQNARSHSLLHHCVEEWRDMLLGLKETGASEALTQFLIEYPHADRQRLRQLQRKAITERAAHRPPSSARALFKLVRESVIPD